MTTSGKRCPPAPPIGFPAPKPLLTVAVHANPEPWVRIFRQTNEPLKFTRSSRGGGNRFDPLPAPWLSTNVLYAGSSLETAIAEALLRWHGDVLPGESLLLSESNLRDRAVARFTSNRDLTLIDCTALGLAAIEAAVAAVLALPMHVGSAAAAKHVADDIFICSPNEYDQTQRWAAWLRSQVPKADGLKWVSRQYNRGECIVLFDDLCGSDLTLAATPLPLYGNKHSAEHRTLVGMLAVLGWGIDK